MSCEKPIIAECGKLIAKVRDGRLYVYCKRCKREHEIIIDTATKEPRAVEPRAVGED